MSIEVVDFFSGCGGTSCGFRNAGMKILAGIDIDSDAASTYRFNFPEAQFLNTDIRKLSPNILHEIISNRKGPLLFAGCAPCQPFSRANKNCIESDSRRNLLNEFARFVAYWLPEYVFVENVPGMQKLTKDSPLMSFQALLTKLNYKFETAVVPASWYGVPQTRERLVLIASRFTSVGIPPATHGPEGIFRNFSTVKEWIGDLPPLAAGEVHSADPDHAAAALSEINIKRIRSTPEGGGRDSWPEFLLLDCHKRHKGHTDVYGRLAWNKQAAGLTTRCISYSNGRFGHPDQDRAISIREAARLQTFPVNYRFYGSLGSRARQIGNAVPPLMAEAVGRHIIMAKG